MLQSRRFTTFALSLCLGATAAFTSCKKEFSKDDPFPYVPSESIYIGSQNQFVYALTPDKGLKKWEFFAGSNIQGTPMLDNNKLYVPTEAGIIYQLDADKGTVLNQLNIGFQILSSPYIKNGLLYIGSGDDSMHCYQASDLTRKWGYPTNGMIISGATLTAGDPNNGDIVVFGCQDGLLRALDADSGQLIWDFNPGNGGAFYSSPTVKDDICYIGNTDGNLYALHTRSNPVAGITAGSLKYSFNAGNQILSSPIVYGGNVIFGCFNSNLYCLDIISGTPRWVVRTGDRIISSPIAVNQIVYVGSYDYYLYAFNIIDGSLKWKFRTEALIKSSPVAYKDKVYVGSYDKHLYAIDTSGGKPAWRYNINGLIESSPVVDNKTPNGLYPSISGASTQ